jgi:phosphatidylethanolamine/phosphatidyl-N-methylethanolamine N-methyltransferase
LRQQLQRPVRTPPPKKMRLEERLADEARFIKSWFDNPLIAGAVSPSGRFLARMMARYVDPHSTGPVIELGPGTGPVTEALLQRGVAQERLVLIEFDPAFCKLLARRFPRATIVQGDAYALAKTLEGVINEPAACVVSSLPLLTKPDAQRLALLEEAFALMGPEGSFVQFTYGVVSPIPRKQKPVSDEAKLAFRTEASPPVWLNLPPARVWIYRPGAELVTLKRGPAHELLDKLKEGTEKVSQEFKKELEEAKARIRQRAALRDSGTTRPGTKPKPALELLRKFAEPGKPRRR